MTYITRFPSLETRWLGRREKQLRQPLVVYRELTWYSGCYYVPKKEEIIIDGVYIPCNLGVIVVANMEAAEIENTLAHEFRHHWQATHKKHDINSSWLNTKGTYKERIVEYFTTYAYEYDALVYSNKFAPSNSSLLWESWVKSSRINCSIV